MSLIIFLNGSGTGLIFLDLKRCLLVRARCCLLMALELWETRRQSGIVQLRRENDCDNAVYILETFAE